jgi:hypothetical protein
MTPPYLRTGVAAGGFATAAAAMGLADDADDLTGAIACRGLGSARPPPLPLPPLPNAKDEAPLPKEEGEEDGDVLMLVLLLPLLLGEPAWVVAGGSPAPLALLVLSAVGAAVPAFF